MDENTTLADLVALNLHNFEDEVRHQLVHEFHPFHLVDIMIWYTSMPYACARV